MKRREALKPRKRTHDSRKHSQASSYIPEGDRMMRRDKHVAVHRPKFDKRPDPLICRPLPAFRPEAPDEWDDFKLGPGLYAFGEWIRRVPAVRYAGEDKAKITFIRYDPRSIPEGDDPESAGLDPYGILHRALRRKIEHEKDPGHKSWLRLMGRNGLLPAPTFMYLIQAVIYQNDDKVYFIDGKHPLGIGPRDMTPVVQMTSSAGQDLADKLAIEKPNYEGDPDDYHAKLVWGDIVHPDTGVFLYIYNPEAWSPPGEGGPRQVEFSDDYSGEVGGEASGGGRRRRKEFAGFETFLSRKCYYDGRDTKFSPQVG